MIFFFGLLDLHKNEYYDRKVIITSGRTIADRRGSSDNLERSGTINGDGLDDFRDVIPGMVDPEQGNVGKKPTTIPPVIFKEEVLRYHQSILESRLWILCP